VKVICVECRKEMGEKAPFSNKEVTPDLCESCWKKISDDLRSDRKHGRKRHRRIVLM
jgi:hypothetical protein